MIHSLLGSGVMVMRLRDPFVLLYLECEDLNIFEEVYYLRQIHITEVRCGPVSLSLSHIHTHTHTHIHTLLLGM